MTKLDLAVFKVFFKGTSTKQQQPLSLTFYNPKVEVPYILPDFPSFLLEFNELARKKEAFSLRNIKEILPLGSAKKQDITQFFIVLYTKKDISEGSSNLGKKEGVLVGNHKDKGYIILGFWPIEQQEKLNEKTQEEIAENYDNFSQILNSIISITDKYSEVILIT